MAPLRFRAWHKKEMCYPPPADEWDWEDCEWFAKYCQDGIVMQSTGLKDKNGKEIFEGDILRRRHGNPTEKNGHKYKVVRWIANPCYNGFSIASPFEGTVKYEVIGNIYENPDLLPASA